MKKLIKNISDHLPYVIGVVLIIMNALIDQNVLHMSDQLINVINALLAAFGLGVLHHRQRKV